MVVLLAVVSEEVDAEEAVSAKMIKMKHLGPKEKEEKYLPSVEYVQIATQQVNVLNGKIKALLNWNYITSPLILSNKEDFAHGV